MKVGENVKRLSRVILISSLLLGGTAFGELNSSAYAAEFDNETIKKVHSLKKLILPNDGANKEETKKNAWKKHNHAINIVEKFYEDQGVTVSNDFDDVKYREQVKALISVVFGFKENEQDVVSEYLKFIDLYENYEENDQIDKLTKKFDEKTISEDELSILFDLGATDGPETLDIPVTDEELKTHLEEDYASINEATVASIIMPEDDPTPITDPTTVNDPNPDSVDTAAGNGYSALKARDYAYKWTSNTTRLRNNASYGYYSNLNNCYDCWWDCTNFVSQAVATGGIKYKGSLGGIRYSANWYYASSYPYSPTFSWGGANSFYLHFRDRARVANRSAHLQTGDVVSLDTGGDSKIDHNVLITKNWGNSSSQKFFTAHETDTKEEYALDRYYNLGYKVYGLEMDRASNF